MRLSFIFFISSSNLRRRKLRSVLTIGGMAVGISVVVFLVSLGFGLQRLIRNQITNVEALTVLDVSVGESTLLRLNDDVVNQFGKIDSVEDVSPSLSISGQLAQSETVTDIAIYGIVPKFISMEGIKIDVGDEFSAEDAEEILVTSTALSLINIPADKEVVGKTLILKVQVPKKIEGSAEEELVGAEIPVKVMGIINDTNDLSIVYAPIKFLENQGFPADYSQAKVKVQDLKDKEYNLARVKVTDKDKLPEVRKQIETMGYQVDSIADTVGQIDKIFSIFQIIVASFGAIALFVAAMGSLNTLTVSLLERTREIGLMKSLGSASSDIYRLFLVEAVVIGVTGGIVGIALGLGISEVVNVGLNYLAQKAGGQPVDVFFTPYSFLLLIFGVILLVSVFTGLYPARRAAKINPLDALRYE